VAKSIRVSDEIFSEIEAESSVSSRSLNGQAEHWIKIGKAIEQSESFSYQHVKQALSAQRPLDSLSLEEQEVFFKEFDDLMVAEPSSEEAAFYANLKGPGMDEAGNIIN